MSKKLSLLLMAVVLGACVYVCAKTIEVPEAPAGVMLLGGGTGATTTVVADACATCPDAANGADVLCEDFEEADDYLCSWTEGIGDKVDITTPGHSGTLNCTNKGSAAWNLDTNTTEDYAYWAAGGDFTVMYVSFYINSE